MSARLHRGVDVGPQHLEIVGVLAGPRELTQGVEHFVDEVAGAIGRRDQRSMELLEVGRSKGWVPIVASVVSITGWTTSFMTAIAGPQIALARS